MNSNFTIYYTSEFTHNYQYFSSVLQKYKYHLNLGDIIAGTIFSKEKNGFIVDIGAKISAYLPYDEICLNTYQPTKPIINETREFFILAYNKKSKQLIISIKRLEYIKAWKRIKQMNQEDITIKLHIHKINKGGLVTTIEGLQAFIPNSHLANNNNKSILLHNQIICQFLLIDEKKNKIIFSNKRAILKNLNKFIYIGQVTYGKITKIESYGIFIEIYGFSALLHISEIDNQIKTKDLFQIGNMIKIKIIHIDIKQGRLSVSRRNLYLQNSY